MTCSVIIKVEDYGLKVSIMLIRNERDLSKAPSRIPLLCEVR